MPLRQRDPFTRRERQMMDIIFKMGEATAAEVMDRMTDPPSYSAVRATLRTLEQKGHVRHHDDGTRYVYRPTASPEKARNTALEHLLTTFFDGSASRVVSTLLERPGTDLSEDELTALSELIERARKDGR